jgi:hypothetical protein
MELNWALQLVELVAAMPLLWFSIRFAAKACASMDSQRYNGRDLSHRMVAAAILQCKKDVNQDQASKQRPTGCES